MKFLLTLILILASCPLFGQGIPFPNSAALASNSGPPVTGNVYIYLIGSCSGTSCTGPVTVCLSSNATSCTGSQVANTSIFYTTDGTPANEADQYYGPGGSSGEFTIPDPGTTRTITINAVLVQTKNTGTVINTGAITSGCSAASPCYGVVKQNAFNTRSSPAVTNVACPQNPPSGGGPSCPSSVFNQSGAVMPHVQYGGDSGNNCTSGTDRGTRGTPNGAWYYLSLSQPTVDLFTNSGTSIEMDLSTAGVNCVGTNGDTEYLIPGFATSNLVPGYSGDTCDTCTALAVSYYTGHNHQGVAASTGVPSGANLSEAENDNNYENNTFNSATGFGYGTFNIRCSMSAASPYISPGGQKYGVWQYSTQAGSWKTFPSFFPSVATVTHDCSMPFGTVGTVASSGCSITFSPGITNSLYQGGENSYGIEPGILLIDQGNAKAESIQILSVSGNTVTSCVRGIGGTTPQSHTSGAFASLMVKVQAHATVGSGSGSSGCDGSSSALNAVFMDYVAFNGNYYGTSVYQPLMGSGLPTPSITTLNVWGTQTAGGLTQSKVCSWFYGGSGSHGLFHQIQPYTKPGTGNPAKIGLFDFHDNITQSWGIVGSASQTTITQAP